MDNNSVIERITANQYDTAPFNRSGLIPPFFRYRELFLVVPKYYLSFCMIEKVMTTISNAIFCFITNTSEFRANNRRISTETYAIR
ncbi:hypothetical protein OESDEN_03031 [Oesophagostomum dentatum]|uniref:Uncharacterized protein n=1 Tax=Oesophagostomum dentatum TaxID=61180 RepID=A0A0B1THG5_OESDE|nr:hypothetical protein OESDEN_03031 [Oesophagostomum dentatum]